MQHHYTTPGALWRVGPLSPRLTIDLLDALAARVPAAYQPGVCAIVTDDWHFTVYLAERVPHMMTWLCLFRLPVEEAFELPDLDGGQLALTGGKTLRHWAERLNNERHIPTIAKRTPAAIQRRTRRTAA